MHVVVIGAGLLGTCTAWFLRKHGIDVTVLETREGAGLETSWGNGGYSQAGYPEPWNIPGISKMLLPAWKATWGEPSLEAAMLIRTRALPGLVGWGLSFLKHATPAGYHHSLIANRKLAHYSQQTFFEIDRELKLEYAMKNNGGLWVFRDQASLDHYAVQANLLKDYGTRFNILDRTEIGTMERSLAPIAGHLAGGLHFDGEFSADPHLFCTRLAKAAENAGAEFFFRQNVKEISKAGDAIVIKSNDDEIRADKLVIAAGSNSTQLARSLGIKLPIRPAKGYSISIPMQGWENRPSHVVVDMGLHAGTNPMGNFLRVAGSAEFAGFDLSISTNRIDSLFRLVEQIYPEFAAGMDRENCQPWAGLRPLSADGKPFIGESGIKNVFLNTGHGGLGWTQAAGSGKALADHIAGKDKSFDLSEFANNRS